MNTDQHRLAGRTVWIVGASSGIGSALAKELGEIDTVIFNGLEHGRLEIVFPVPMAVLMKVARCVPVRLWAAAMSRTAKFSKGAR